MSDINCNQTTETILFSKIWYCNVHSETHVFEGVYSHLHMACIEKFIV
jgi:hypothetical protein